MNFGPLSDLARGVPYHGRAQRGSYGYYTMSRKDHYRRSRDGRIYDMGHVSGGWKAANKPTSQRDRHRAGVELRERLPESAFRQNFGGPSGRSEHEKSQAAQRAHQERQARTNLLRACA